MEREGEVTKRGVHSTNNTALGILRGPGGFESPLCQMAVTQDELLALSKLIPNAQRRPSQEFLGFHESNPQDGLESRRPRLQPPVSPHPDFTCISAANPWALSANRQWHTDPGQSARRPSGKCQLLGASQSAQGPWGAPTRTAPPSLTAWLRGQSSTHLGRAPRGPPRPRRRMALPGLSLTKGDFLTQFLLL